MLPRVILIFVFLALIVLAVRKGFSPTREIVQAVPGYPAPVALKKFEPVSDDDFLKNLPLAADYAFSMNVEDESKPKPVQKKKVKAAKRAVAAKSKSMKR